jgi:L-fucose isomerase-like protein
LHTQTRRGSPVAKDAESFALWSINPSLNGSAIPFATMYRGTHVARSEHCEERLLKYAHILLAVASEPWAMLPEKLLAMLDLLRLQASG